MDLYEKFNFGHGFINWVKTIYTDSRLCIKNNGYISETFDLSRGIKQGCPLSALLFIISVEIMALRLKQSTQFKGYVIKSKENEREIKISQYADDGTLFLRDRAQLEHVIKVIQEYGRHSGLTLNTKKTIGMYLGQHAGQKGIVCGIQITNDNNS